MTVSAIILAAGESTRMGRPKQLLPWDGATLLAWQVRQMLQAGADDVVVVLGHEAAAITTAIDAVPARLLVNGAYRDGRAGSLRLGATAIADDVEAVLILNVDQPRPAWISAHLLADWQIERPPLAMPVYEGRRGHPVLVRGDLLPELRSVDDASLGLRAVTERHAGSTLLVPVDSPIVHLDVNTPAEYEQALALLGLGPAGQSR